MKKLVTLSLILAFPLSSNALITPRTAQVNLEVPYSSFQRLDPIEEAMVDWECPISAVVSANDGADALAQIRENCLDEVIEAAGEYPDIYGVIEVSVAWPSVKIQEVGNQFRLEGTIFLKALVLQ